MSGPLHSFLGELRQVSAGILRGLRLGVLPLAAFEVLAKSLAAGVLGPLSAWIVAMFIATTGSVTVSNEQILVFVLSPMGVLTALVAGSLAFLINYVEQAGLMAIAWAALSGGKLPAIAALRHVISRGGHLLILAALKMALYFACLVPCAAVAGAAYAVWLTDYDINFYLAEKPPAFWRAVAVGVVTLAALLLACGWLYLRTIFALPACILAGLRPLASLKASWQLTGGTVRRIAAILITWSVLISLLGSLISILLQLVEHLGIGLAGERLGLLLPTLAALVTLNLLAAAGVSLVGATTNSLLVVHLYREGTKDRPALQPEAPVKPVAGERRLRFVRGWRAVLAAAVLFLVATGVVTHLLVEQIGIEDHTAVTAHRGSSLVAPENTLSAVEAAIRQGADFAEIDVQETADGVVVALHDSDLKRITGRDKRIWEVTYREIESLDAGSWFSDRFEDERIPTLQQMIDAARGRIRLHIELKFNGHDEMLVERVVDVIRENGFHAQCVVSSLEHEGVVEAKRLDQRLKVGYIVSVALGDVSKVDVDFLSLHHKNVRPALIRSLHRADREVHAWTVNDPKRMSELVDLGVDSIITDDPEALRSVLDQRAEMSNTERLLLGVRSWLAQ